MERVRVHYLQRMYARKAPADDGTKCMNLCGHKEPLITAFRCDSCFGSRLLCGSCIKHEHQYLPFHRIQSWTNNIHSTGDGSYFKPISLDELAFELHLGHNGQPCPERDSFGSNSQSTLTVVHTNGSHRININYCTCPENQPRDIQLIDHGLFPATTTRPSTAFTFQLLRHFQIFNMASKTSAWDYHNGLLRMTNSIEPDAVPV